MFAAGSGDIWSSGVFSFDSPLKDLLDSGNDYSLEDLLAEDELLQELRGQHETLLAYFATPEAVTKLIFYITLPPDAPIPAIQEEEQQQPLDEDGGEEMDEAGDAASAPTSSSNTTYREPAQWLNDQKSKDKAKAPSHYEPELYKIRFPYMACEIVCCEIENLLQVLITETVHPTYPMETNNSNCNNNSIEVQPKRIMDMLFDVFFDTEVGELDDHRAGYVEKVLNVLLRKQPQALMDYLNREDDASQSLLKAMIHHLYAHSVTQVVQRFMLPKRPQPVAEEEEQGELVVAENDPTSQSGDASRFHCEWAGTSEGLEILIDKLLLLDEDYLPEDLSLRFQTSKNASEVLVVIIQNSLLSSSTILQLTDPAVLTKLVQGATQLTPDPNTFAHEESTLTNAMNVLESLILQLGGYGAIGTMSIIPEENGEENNNASAQEGKTQLIADETSLVASLPELLGQFAKLLRHPSCSEWTSPMQFSKTSAQQLLGTSRLRIVRVLEALVLLGKPDVDTCIIESGCLRIALELFWEFPWCSMLHQSVANMLVHIFEGHDLRFPVQKYLIDDCRLLSHLMDSFTEVPSIHNVKQNAKVSRGSLGRSLPVSEDDVESALENGENDRLVDISGVDEVSRQAVNQESRGASTVDESVPAQSFRMGYMGHVIIVCQALLGCTVFDADSEGEDPAVCKEPPKMADLIEEHQDFDRWLDFVTTTLASETSVQSTPLGGYSSGGTDPLHSHRPGLADDADDGGPYLPPHRSLLNDSDGIDMDEDDLDIAATMMAGMSMTVGSGHSADSGNFSVDSGDSDRSYNSGETNSSGGGYLFDDPLGKSRDGLGIELGRLTKLGRKGVGSDEKSNDNDEDEGGDSSSDDSSKDDPNESKDKNIMNLYAGNFDYAEPDAVEELKFEAFADFGAFSSPEIDSFGDFESALDQSLVKKPNGDSIAEEVFGKGDHADLLEREPDMNGDTNDLEPTSTEKDFVSEGETVRAECS